MNPMESHVKVLAVLHIAFGFLGVLLGLGGVLALGGVASLVQMDGDPDAAAVAPVLGAIAVLVLVLALVLSVPGIIAGVGLLSIQPWARILTIVLSGLNLLNVPLGTALGVYGLWVLLSSDGVRLFEQRRAASLAER